MSKIYLPSEYVNSSCKVIYNDYIRVYTNTSRTEYVDIFVNQDYMVKSGTTNYTQNVICDDVNEYTDDIYYRTDFDNILIIFIIFVLIIVYIPLTLVYRFIKKGRYIS